MVHLISAAAEKWLLQDAKTPESENNLGERVSYRSRPGGGISIDLSDSDDEVRSIK
jgi:hypothetical protein